MVLRQLPAAIWRSAALSSNCMSFSASAKGELETAGPTSGATPNAGGAPGGGAAEFGVGLRHAAAAAISAAEERPRNWRREFDISPPNHILPRRRVRDAAETQSAKGRGIWCHR